MNWTKEQEDVIRLRGTTMLVSAAAGSGKTAVLVERILSRITDPDDPADIDRLLVVTFTRAAAAEMRERIADTLAQRIEAAPDDLRLSRQLSLLPAAMITTIDGFCSYVVRSYGHTTGIDTARRIAQDGEAKALAGSVADELLENSYADQPEGFRIFAETFAPGKTDKTLAGLLLTIASHAESAPDPKACLARYEALLSDDVPFSETPLYAAHLAAALEAAEEGRVLAEKLLALTKEPAGPSAYRPCAEAECALFTALSECGTDHDGLRRTLLYYTPPRLSSAKPKPGEDPLLRDTFKEMRARIKEIREDLLSTYFLHSLSDAEENDRLSLLPLRTLVRLTQEYLAHYDEAKQKKGILDFSDIEHEALRILTGPDGAPTAAARELSERFSEVYVDEYQDSNQLQEAILSAVLHEKKDNYFMVGDVKQSIYRFRKADPSLFLEKADRFRSGDGGVRCDLTRNFRSRPEIIAAVNAVFSAAMRREAGGVPYDEAAYLRPGAEYPPYPGEEDGAPSPFLCEAHLIYDPHEDDDTPFGARDRQNAEAYVIGCRIREMLEWEVIYDREKGAYRPVRYGDIVILLRSAQAVGDAFAETLTRMGIPVFITRKTGYFDAEEVQTVLNYLSVLDNPRQDIPLAASLRSSIADFSASDLAVIRAAAPAAPTTAPAVPSSAPAAEEAAPSGTPSGTVPLSFYDCVLHYAAHGSNELLRARLRAFLDLTAELRERSKRLPVHLLLWELYDRTGYAAYAAAMPDGAQRTANLSMLIAKATEYERTSYEGLYHFIRYIRELKSYEVDFGASPNVTDGEAVRLMTIHGSKGLEFPVVFVSGLGRGLNRGDVNAAVLVHPKCGLASEAVDTALRVRIPTLRRALLRQLLLDEENGEELRVLYVALTRARQKLILTGTLKDREKTESLKKSLGPDGRLPVSYLRKSQKPFDFLLPQLLAKDCSSFLSVREWDAPAAAEAGQEEACEKEALTASLQTDPGTPDPALSERYGWRYPYGGGVPAKVSVSELKAKSYPHEDSYLPYEAPPVIPYLPSFLRTETDLSGADRGTLYHRFLQHFDYLVLPSSGAAQGGAAQAETAEDVLFRAAVDAEKDRVVREGYFTEAEIPIVRTDDILAFLASPIGIRMHRAARSGQLRRETPFTIAIAADRVDPAYPENENVLVQGVVDAWFYEGGKIILVDYKTDRVTSADGDDLVRKYALQLSLYKEALSGILEVPVRESWIYSFALRKAIPLP